jgi:hypothetical protein
MRKSVIIAFIASGVFLLASCSKDTSAEKEGEKLDSAIEEATTGEIDRGDGPMENIGEAIDNVTGQQNDDPVDAIHDAIEDESDPPS